MEKFSWFLLGLSLTENFLLLTLNLTFLGIQIKWKEFLLQVIALSLIILSIRSFPVTVIVTLFASFFAYILLLKLIYKVPLILSLISTGLSHLIYSMSEITVIPWVLKIIANDNQLPLVPKFRALLFLVQLSVILAVIFVLKLSKLNFAEKLAFLYHDKLVLVEEVETVTNSHKVYTTLLLVIVFIILQGLFIIAYTWTERFDKMQLFNIDLSFFHNETIITILVAALSIALVWLIFNLVQALRIQSSEVVEWIKQKNLQRLNWELRMQYHDFNHHLGMLDIMLKMEKYSQARDYLRKLVGELSQIKEIVKSGNQYLNALIYSKMAWAKQYGVEIKVRVERSLPDLEIPSIELVRIMGNLLNNAVEALHNYPGEKRVEVIINANDKESILEVKTLGIVISDEVAKNIFKRGFTTKQEEGHGLGLAICKELVEKNKGQIIINKDTLGQATSFIVKLPQAKKKE